MIFVFIKYKYNISKKFHKNSKIIVTQNIFYLHIFTNYILNIVFLKHMLYI